MSDNFQNAPAFWLKVTKGEPEGKAAIAQTKRKRNPPEVRQDPLKKPRSALGLHMQESIQVFHTLGKRRDPARGQSSSRFLENANKTKGFQPSSILKRKPHTTREEKDVEQLQIQSKTTSSNAGENSSSSSVYELPPPGKVKLIPLPFFPPEKPVCRRRRPKHLAGRALAATHTTMPDSSRATQATAGKSFQPIPSPVAISERAAQSFLENAPQATLKKPSNPPLAPSETSRPTSVQATFSSRQRDPDIKVVINGESPLKNQYQLLLTDFSAQGIPWREPNIPGPVMSTPITEEQRPEREALKRKAQRERYNASKNTSLGKLRFFRETETSTYLSTLDM